MRKITKRMYVVMRYNPKRNHIQYIGFNSGLTHFLHNAVLYDTAPNSSIIAGLSKRTKQKNEFSIVKVFVTYEYYKDVDGKNRRFKKEPKSVEICKGYTYYHKLKGLLDY